MNRAAELGLAGPVVASPGVPLRVAVYQRVSMAIQSGTLPPSSLLPSETQLCEAMGVSRTVIREALMLAEEDGYIRSRRGIGRFVEDDRPTRGIERLQPLEALLTGRGRPVQARRLRAELTRPSHGFASDGLGIDPQDASWFVETSMLSEGRVVALLQEHLPVSRDHRFDELIDDAIAADRGGSILAALMPLTEIEGKSEISAGVPGATRGRLLDLAPDAPVILLTQRIEHGGRAFYLSKALLNPEFAQLEVRHTL